METLAPSPDRFEATLGHIALLAAKRERLLEAQIEAENQLAFAAARAYRQGELSTDDLADVYLAVRAAGAPGYSKRWDFVAPLSSTRLITIVKLARANGPFGTWLGDYPIPPGSPAPITGMNVAYVLYDPRNAPCYVGSTACFRQRVKTHSKEGKPVVYWQAYPCPTRQAAYELEDRLLKEHKPYLNRRAAR